jgi:hypothetical protein
MATRRQDNNIMTLKILALHRLFRGQNLQHAVFIDNKTFEPAQNRPARPKNHEVGLSAIDMERQKIFISYRRNDAAGCAGRLKFGHFEYVC